VKLSQRLLISSLKTLTNLICRIDAREVDKIPLTGPLIIYTNHVNLLEIPILYTRFQPRRLRGMILARRWDNPILRKLLDIAEAIPLRRGEADITAIHKGMQALERGEIVGIAPEGTRSYDGQLQRAHPGVVLLALHSQAPLLPLAFYGAENFKENLSRLRRSDFHIRVGVPFRLDDRGERVSRQVRQAMVDEMMLQLAVLLPPSYLGYYADQPGNNFRYLVYH
jgi:1-acyl-sn-glycerol-3-phosphate acyltransferase